MRVSVVVFNDYCRAVVPDFHDGDIGEVEITSAVNGLEDGDRGLEDDWVSFRRPDACKGLAEKFHLGSYEGVYP